MTDLPRHALSVRQPWAWAIIEAGKDIENRTWRSPNVGLNFRGTVAIHAAVGMSRDEYEDAAEAIREITGYDPPLARNLIRGALIGMVDVVGVVRTKISPWFFGPVGLVLRNPRPIPPIPCKGQLGFFAWQPSGGEIAAPMKWMLPTQTSMGAGVRDLFGDKS